MCLSCCSSLPSHTMPSSMSASEAAVAAAVDAVTTGERTKYKALSRHVYETIARANAMATGKPLEEETEEITRKINQHATILRLSKENPVTTSTKPDKRFPNTNQVNNCWCAPRAR
jgi:hypothetical protein